MTPRPRGLIRHGSSRRRWGPRRQTRRVETQAWRFIHQLLWVRIARRVHFANIEWMWRHRSWWWKARAASPLIHFQLNAQYRSSPHPNEILFIIGRFTLNFTNRNETRTHEKERPPSLILKQSAPWQPFTDPNHYGNWHQHYSRLVFFFSPSDQFPLCLARLSLNIFRQWLLAASPTFSSFF